MAIGTRNHTVDARPEPLGIDTAEPELAWKLTGDQPIAGQAAYAVQVATSEAFGDDDLVWDSGRTAGARPFGIRYAGVPLESMRRYWWRVRVWATLVSGEAVEGMWSEPTWFETAVLDPARWRARWITGPAPTSKVDDRVLYLRGAVELEAEVVRARAYVSALGWYRLFVNGHDQTGSALVPRWTPFDRVVEYQTYDVTDALRRGGNVLAIAVGDGRYRGGLGLFGSRDVYGDRTAAFAQVEIELADGTTRTAVTDGTWHAGPGRITGSDPKNGERADLRIPDHDWLTDLVPPRRFGPASILAEQRHALIAEEVGRVRDVARLRPEVRRAPSGAQLLDFGQNFAGVVSMKLRGPAGRTVQLTHSELLTPDGELDTDYILLRKKKPWYQRETIVLDGRDGWYEPWFTIHGFRYVEVTGLDDEIDPDDIEGIVLSSDLPETSTFACSDGRLEQLHRNVRWSMRSNFTDTPTDCPTRERSGWTGDIQVFAPTAAVLADVQAYLRRYLRILALEQYDDGAVPLFIPSEQPTSPGWKRRLTHVMSKSAGWADAAVLVPWSLYERYGDQRVLEQQYDSMKRWVDRVAADARHAGRGRPLRTVVDPEGRALEHLVVDRNFHFGEWLRPGETGGRAVRNMVRPPAAVATAYFAHSTGVLAQAASVLGRQDDADRYQRMASEIREAWRFSFVGPDGRIGADRQDDYVRALAFDLLLPEQRPAAVARLAELVEANGDHLDTGFLSTAMLLPALSEGGRADLAVRLLLQTTNPSWLHQIERGATTVWETWEGFREDGRGKESHNHYAFGAVAGWLTEGLAGLSPAEPAYRRIRIAPVVADGIDHASTTVETPYGTACCGWRRDGEGITLDVTVPPGTTATIDLPDGARSGLPATLAAGSHSLRWTPADVGHRPERRTVVLFGDSITEGKTSASYVELLRQRLSADGYRFVNLGVGGDTARNLVRRLPAVIDAQPDAVSIMVGTNDLQAYLRGGTLNPGMQVLKRMSERVTVEWYSGLVRHIVERLQAETSATIALCSVPVLGEALDSAANDAARLFNGSLQELAVELGVAYLPVHESMTAELEAEVPAGGVPFDQDVLVRRMLGAVWDAQVRGRSWEQISTQHGLVLTTDLIHPNGRGAAIVADRIEEWLRSTTGRTG
jgi:alpha-L-rhamnosidase